MFKMYLDNRVEF